jgi:hypothetical protein
LLPIKTLKDYCSFARQYKQVITSETTRSILFQICWTLAILQNKWPGFHYSSNVNFADTIRLYNYSNARCFRILQNDTTFCIPSQMPLVIFTQLQNSKWGVEEALFDSKHDIKSVLTSMLEWSEDESLESMAPVKDLMEDLENAPNMYDVVFAETFNDYLSLKLDTVSRAQVFSL